MVLAILSKVLPVLVNGINDQNWDQEEHENNSSSVYLQETG
jgi:hypothetical protein